mgnify:CR=1 FL=1
MNTCFYEGYHLTNTGGLFVVQRNHYNKLAYRHCNSLIWASIEQQSLHTYLIQKQIFKVGIKSLNIIRYLYE